MAEKNTFYSFMGVNPEGYEWHMSPGVLLIRKKDAGKFGGWDENYSGAKGGSDGRFTALAKRNGMHLKRVKGVTVINYAGGSKIEDATSPLDRSEKKESRFKERGMEDNLFNNLRFKWEKV